MSKATLFLIVWFFCVDEAAMAQEKILYDPSYKPAVFTDPGRMEKIKKTFPAIDSIYKKAAIDNHFPGLAFGIVVDGRRNNLRRDETLGERRGHFARAEKTNFQCGSHAARSNSERAEGE